MSDHDWDGEAADGGDLDSFEQRLKSMIDSDLPKELPREVVGLTIAETYTLVSKLGAGGMGDVYLAEHARTHGRLALKLIKSARLADAAGLKRFELEAKNTASLEHPNIVRVFDYGHEDDLVYIAMEYVGGKSLQDVIDETGPLSVDEAIEVADAVLLALEAAHDASIVHRDIKPGNILIAGNGTDRFVKVLDFGIARALEGEAIQTQGIIGSPMSMAPEQFEGGEITPAADLYAVGCLMHAMLTGRGPFSGKYWQLATLHCTEAPPRLEGVPDALAEWTLVLLQKKQENRPASARDALDTLRALRFEPHDNPAAVSTAASSEPPAPTDERQPSARRGLFVVLVGVLLIGIVAMMFTVASTESPQPSATAGPVATKHPAPKVSDHKPIELPVFSVMGSFEQVISPDGERIARASSGVVEVFDRSTTRSTPMDVGGRPTAQIGWFPDGRHLLLSQEVSDGTFCTVKAALDGVRTKLFCRDSAIRAFAAPDGQQIAYTTDERVVLADLDGSNERVLDDRSASGPLQWMSDGSGVLFFTRIVAGGDFELRFASPSKSSVLASGLKGNIGSANIVPIAALPNRELVFGGWDGVTDSLWHGRVDENFELVDVMRVIGPAPHVFAALSASRLGDVAYCRAQSHSDIQLGTFGPNGLEQTRYVASASSSETLFDWGASGMLFTSDRASDQDLFVVEPESGHVTQLTASAAGVMIKSPRFVSNSGEVAYFESLADGVWPRIRDADGTVTTFDVGRQLPLQREGRAFPRMDIRCEKGASPSCVVHQVSDTTSTFRRFDVAARKIGAVIAEIPLSQNSPTPSPANWDLLGADIVVAYGPASKGMTLIDTATGSTQNIAVDGESVGYIISTAWHRPAGESILVGTAGPVPGEFHLLSIDRSGAVRPLFQSVGDALLRPVSSPDGKRMAWTRNRFQCTPWTFRLPIGTAPYTGMPTRR